MQTKDLLDCSQDVLRAEKALEVQYEEYYEQLADQQSLSPEEQAALRSDVTREVEMLEDASSCLRQAHQWASDKADELTTRLREVSRTADTAAYAFTIRDTGIGMTQDFIDNHLFEAFSQEDNAARSQYGGTGLGMSIVNQLVQKMNGTITVESTVGEGSCFTVTLPFAIDHDPPAAGPEKEAPADLHGKRLLVVEDNELNMEIVEFMLKSAGAEVVKAFDGESAVRAFAADPAGYDAILMDLMMPVMDGYAAARAIRASGQTRAGTVPIIAMSANAYAEDVKKCLDSGMNAHISKPLFKDVMLRTIARFV